MCVYQCVCLVVRLFVYLFHSEVFCVFTFAFLRCLHFPQFFHTTRARPSTSPVTMSDSDGFTQVRRGRKSRSAASAAAALPAAAAASSGEPRRLNYVQGESDQLLMRPATAKEKARLRKAVIDARFA